jgi:ATP-dependent Clp protease ATP-binding subunit ClpA
MFERFTDRSRRVLVYAQDHARDLNVDFIGTEHILLGLAREAEGVAAKALSALGVTYDAVRDKVEKATDHDGPSPSGAPAFTARAKKVLELSLGESLHLGHNYIGTEHLLLGLVREGGGKAAQIVRDLGVELTQVREKTLEMISGQVTHESGNTYLRGQVDSTALRGIVRNIGQHLRPDLDATSLDDRAAKIAHDLYEHLRKFWGEPDSPS